MLDTIKIAHEIDSQINFLTYDGYKNISPLQLQRLIKKGYSTGPEYVSYEKIYQHNNGYLPSCGVQVYKNNKPRIWFRFSVPKLIYGNNIKEVTQSDFWLVVKELQAKALVLGIDITQQAIKESLIWELHVGKNIDLQSTGLDSMSILSMLNKLAFDGRLSMNKVFYLNVFDETDKLTIDYEAGEKWSVGCKSYEYCFYDKTAEVKKDDYGRNILNTHPNLNNILRCEYRLYKAESVKSGLQKVGIQPYITFEQFFTDDIFKILNMYIWCKLIKPQLCWVGFFEQDPIQLLSKMKQLKIKPINCLKLLGVYYLGLTESKSSQTLKLLFPPRSNVLKRLIQQIEAVNGVSGTLKNAFQYIESEIEKNIPLV